MNSFIYKREVISLLDAFHPDETEKPCLNGSYDQNTGVNVFFWLFTTNITFQVLLGLILTVLFKRVRLLQVVRVYMRAITSHFFGIYPSGTEIRLKIERVEIDGSVTVIHSEVIGVSRTVRYTDLERSGNIAASYVAPNTMESGQTSESRTRESSLEVYSSAHEVSIPIEMD